MNDRNRRVEDVIGTDPAMLEYWDKMPDNSKLRLLDSVATVSTLGELQLMDSQLSHLGKEAPKVF